MDTVHRVKMWIGGLTEIGLMLLALAIVAALLVGGQLPFFGGVVANIIAMVAQLGGNGLVGLIVLGIIMWLFSHRSFAWCAVEGWGDEPHPARPWQISVGNYVLSAGLLSKRVFC